MSDLNYKLREVMPKCKAYLECSGTQDLREYLHALAFLKFEDEIKSVLRELRYTNCRNCIDKAGVAEKLLKKLEMLSEWEEVRLAEAKHL